MLTIDSLLADGAPPIVAVLRGLAPSEALDVGAALLAGGVRMMEVPLNSPDPFTSIAAMQGAFGDQALVGAGTVLDVDSVERLADTGARLMVTPNTNPQVIAKGLALQLELMPGCLTPTEALTASAAGATRLKLFPATSQNHGYVRDLRAVLPRNVTIWANGGIDETNAISWITAGCEGVGVGSSLYKPGVSPTEVRRMASLLAANWKASQG